MKNGEEYKYEAVINVGANSIEALLCAVERIVDHMKQHGDTLDLFAVGWHNDSGFGVQMKYQSGGQTK